MQTVLSDLRFALRQLRRAPGFAITAVLTLALGIGANTAIFSLLDQALLRSLPVHDPQSLVVLRSSTATWNGSTSSYGGDPNDYFSYPMYKDLRDQNQVFSGLIVTTAANAGFSRGASSQVVDTEVVSGNYFSMLGVQPALGRLFTNADDAADGANPLTILSFDFWRTQLAADPNIVGSTVNLNGRPFQVIGVAAPSFHSAVWGETPSIFVTMSMRDSVTGHFLPITDRHARWLNLIGRIKPGLTLAQAQAGINPLWHALRADEVKTGTDKSPRFIAGFLTNNQLLLRPGARGFSYTRSGLETPFLAVMAMALLVLLISAVNVASLLLVRSAGRIREFSLRTALGARASRVFAQLLLEGLLIGLAGGTVGLLLAPPGLRVLVNRLSSPDSVSPWSASVDLRVLAFNFAIAVAVSLFFSLAPALQLRKLNIVSNLREGSSTGAGALLSLRRVVVCLQIGLSVILLIASGLFLRTMQHLRAVDVGFNTSNLASVDLDPTLAGYKTTQMPALHERILAALAQIPGVAGVAATNDPELANSHSVTNVSVAGYTAPPEDTFGVELSAVTENYFQVMGIPLLAGRSLTPTDNLDHPEVTVVNAAFARHFCGSPQTCIGRRMGQGAGDKTKLGTEIIGVVRDASHYSVRGEPVATMFLPVRQIPRSDDLTYYLRSYGDPTQTLLAVRSALRQVDPGLAPTALRTMQGQIDLSLQNERLIALLAVSFGALATLLAGIGLYGVLAYSTAQRTHEIGIRMALGSSRIAVSSLILKDVLRLAALGIVLAIPIALALGRLIRAQLFGVTPADPLILASVVAVISTVAFLAALIPARRAAAVEPTTALRTE
jgi:putative ABC transport system permease protein